MKIKWQVHQEHTNLGLRDLGGTGQQRALSSSLRLVNQLLGGTDSAGLLHRGAD